MLKLRNVHCYYEHSHILQGVSLEVPEGSLVALLGRNGMGKTTTIRSIIGFNPPDSGEILFKGQNIAGLPSYKIAQRGIALVPQGRRIFRSLTVKENLLLGWRRENKGKTNFDPGRIYELFPILRERAQNRGGHLSGGEQQMLAVARALLTNPDLLLMDEPFEGLAPAIIKELRLKIQELKSAGLAILLVEQNIQAALQLADRVYIMSKGKIAYEGTATQLQDEEEIKKRFLAV